MPTAKQTTQAEETKVEPGLEKPTREEIFNAALVVAKHTNLVPTLLGPTAAGKTYGMLKLAEQHNAEVVSVLLGQHTPDEIAGFQLALNNELVIQMPFWFKEAQNILDRGKNAWILFDELGLSREETRGALYTFMRDRHLHGHRLNTPQGTTALVFAASNPATFAPPFKSRCLFLTVASDPEYLLGIAAGSDFVTKVVRLAPHFDNKDPFYSNDGPPAPVVVNAASIAALKQLTTETEFWRLSEPARYEILAGLVPHQTLAAVLKETSLNVVLLAKNWQETDRVLRALPKDKMHSMINNIVESLNQLTPEERADVLLSILDVLYSDLSGVDLQTYFSTSHSESAATAAMEIDPLYLERRLEERGLLKVTTKGQNNIVSGSFRDRIEKIVQNTNEDTK